MAMTATLLYRGQPGTTVATVYTSTGLHTIIKQVVVANVTSSAAQLQLFNVATGGSAGVTNALIYNVSFPGASVTTFDLSQVMNSGDFIAALQGTSAALTVHVSGITF